VIVNAVARTSTSNPSGAPDHDAGKRSPACSGANLDVERAIDEQRTTSSGGDGHCREVRAPGCGRTVPW